MVRQWRVKKRRLLRDRRGNVVGRPGDLLPEDDENAIRDPSAVELVEVETKTDDAPLFDSIVDPDDDELKAIAEIEAIDED